MDLVSSSPMVTMSLASNRAGMPNLASATEKAKWQLLNPSLAFKLSKSSRSGLNLAIIAQKARPDLHEEEKSLTDTPGYPEVTCLHQCNRAGTPVCNMSSLDCSPLNIADN